MNNAHFFSTAGSFVFPPMYSKQGSDLSSASDEFAKKISLSRNPTQELIDLSSSKMSITVPQFSEEDLQVKTEVHKKYDSIKTLRTVYNKKIEQLGDTQRAALSRKDIDSARVQEEALVECEKSIREELGSIHNIVKSYTLEAYILVVLRDFIAELQIILSQLELYRKEILNHFKPEREFVNYSLVITSQPFPIVLFKEKPIEECYVVSLLKGISHDIGQISEVKAKLLTGEFVYKSNKEPLSGNVSVLDHNQYKATFPDLTVNISTRMNSIYLQFGTSIRTSSDFYHINSTPSHPFIIITNESQWCEAAGKLLNVDSFGGTTSIPWPQFINTVHSHYLRATRQDNKYPTEIERPLYNFEINYLHDRFFKKDSIVSEGDAQRFWSWFGQCVHTIRFKRHINQLWIQGYILGFTTRDTSNQFLTNQPQGTFLIRFSESNPGLFGIAHVTDEGSIQHGIVRGEDIGSNKSLAEFLRDKSKFKYILQFLPQNETVNRVPKDEALNSFYSKKRTSMSEVNGYIVL